MSTGKRIVVGVVVLATSAVLVCLGFFGWGKVEPAPAGPVVLSPLRDASGPGRRPTSEQIPDQEKKSKATPISAEGIAREGGPASGEARKEPFADVAKMLDEGVALISDNSGDSAGFSRADLERGIALIQESLRLGHPDQKRGLQALVRGYATLGSFSPEENAAVTPRVKEIYQRLQAIDPGEPQWVAEYADLIADRAERVRALSEGIKRFPRDRELHTMLGVLLCQQGEKGAGSAHLVEAARLLTPADLQDFSDDLKAYASECGDADNRDTVYAIVDQKNANAAPGGREE